MGRYSRKDMIEFANFAKSYCSTRKVVDAYEIYLSSKRLVPKKKLVPRKILIIERMRNSNIIYLDGKTIKDRYHEPDVRIIGINDIIDYVDMKSWNRKDRILKLVTKPIALPKLNIE